jgi:hypothetical protein
MRLSSGLAAVPLLIAAFVSQQEPPWCFRPHGAETARCDYYSLQACLAGTLVFGGKCERYHATPGQLTPGQQTATKKPKKAKSAR